MQTYHQAVCCEDNTCCWAGFVCQAGGCALGDVGVNGTQPLWIPGVPIIRGSTLPP